METTNQPNIKLRRLTTFAFVALTVAASSIFAKPATAAPPVPPDNCTGHDGCGAIPTAQGNCEIRESGGTTVTETATADCDGDGISSTITWNVEYRTRETWCPTGNGVRHMAMADKDCYIKWR